MSTPDREIKTVMHQLKQRTLTVKKIEELNSRMRRITFTGSELKDFVSLSPDDHIKVFLPSSGEDKPIMRDYTPRRYDNNALELDIEFVLHGEGPGSSWASQAQVGAELTIGGPRGSRVVPYSFDWYLMIGDETALPSIGRRLFELPAHSKAIVIVEVEDETHRVQLPLSENVQVQWLYRHGRKPGSAEQFKNEILKTGFPVGDYFVWIATEKSVAMQLRDLLVTVRGANEQWVKATGYWNASKDDHHG
ncbi:siderophore-interacting protein [Bdellovibrio sp. NC01]|uniref:siderophore-interacting protein n=1 Tax=Bdellovibrio sp. NC01 TaxID=2220073 RepID=UPI00115B874B|nr:siderophore-interacting protein [Bdellovibrio sp. NC01]QDK38181.1 siderophore-interacting protein [Bdellovibrio sp. NC01]